MKVIFKQQLAEAPRTDYLLNYFTFNGKYVTLQTVKLWELGSLCSKYIFEKDDQKGHFLPVFRDLENMEH